MKYPDSDSKLIVGIGEILWDVGEKGRTPGGAPVNFAYHCGQLGCFGVPVSRVGRDVPGRSLLEEVAQLGVDISFLQTDEKVPTGEVMVDLDPGGKPVYQIRENAAWDFLECTPALKVLAERADAVCFGSLSQRHPVSRTAIQEFLHSCGPNTLKIFDVNLRAPFYTEKVILDSLVVGDVLKLSDEELPLLRNIMGLTGGIEDQLRQIQQRYNLQAVAYTRGGEGALVLSREEKIDHPGVPVSALDTVGAGDAFTATLCCGWLQGFPLARTVDWAARVAAYVCSCPGATPRIPDELKSENIFFENN